MEKVLSANEKLDALLTREEVTKIASQKMIDVLEINSKFKGGREISNRVIRHWKRRGTHRGRKSAGMMRNKQIVGKREG